MSNDPENVSAAIQRLADIEAIKQLKAKYVRLADAKQWDEWGKEVLTENVFMHNDGGPMQGRDRVIAQTSKALETAHAVHYLYTPEITITGPDSATAVWPVSDHIGGMFNGSPMVIRGHGHYYDEYIRTSDGWRLKRCHLVRQHVDTLKGAEALAKLEGATQNRN